MILYRWILELDSPNSMRLQVLKKEDKDQGKG